MPYAVPPSCPAGITYLAPIAPLKATSSGAIAAAAILQILVYCCVLFEGHSFMPNPLHDVSHTCTHKHRRLRPVVFKLRQWLLTDRVFCLFLFVLLLLLLCCCSCYCSRSQIWDGSYTLVAKTIVHQKFNQGMESFAAEARAQIGALGMWVVEYLCAQFDKPQSMKSAVEQGLVSGNATQPCPAGKKGAANLQKYNRKSLDDRGNQKTNEQKQKLQRRWE